MAEEEKNEQDAVLEEKEKETAAVATPESESDNGDAVQTSAGDEQSAQAEPRRRTEYKRREGGGQSRGGSDSRQGGGYDRGRSRRGYFRKKVCRMCVSRTNTLDYKDLDLLKRFVTDRGKILPRRMTGTCAKHQRVVSEAVKRARMVALLPFVEK
jgi:small subunit ribosomal protein S18